MSACSRKRGCRGCDWRFTGVSRHGSGRLVGPIHQLGKLARIPVSQKPVDATLLEGRSPTYGADGACSGADACPAHSSSDLPFTN